MMNFSSRSICRAFIVAGGLVGALSGPPILAQDGEPVSLDAAISFLRTDLRAQKPTIFTNALSMSPELSTAFFALYKEYEADLATLSDQRFQLFKDYSNGYATVDDTAAADIARRSAELYQQRAAMRVKYVKRFAKILPGKLLARFWQIDDRLEMVQNLQVAEQIPLMKQ
ncbi:MAG: hypothetical protein ABI609_02930 [Acidobacteriota bacterium]